MYLFVTYNDDHASLFRDFSPMWGVQPMKCHGNLNSSKMSHLPGQTLLLEDIAVDTFVHSSFGTVVMTLFQGLFTAPSWQTFTSLACGWALATDRHTITTYLWLTGATTVKHFSRFYVFLGCPLYNKRWQLWGAVIRLAAQFVPEGEVIRVIFDDTTKKKAGTPYRRARPLPQWRWLSTARIPHAAGLELRVGHHAHSPHTVARPLPQRPGWSRTVSQTRASHSPQRAVSFPQSVGPRYPRLHGRAVARASHPEPG